MSSHFLKIQQKQLSYEIKQVHLFLWDVEECRWEKKNAKCSNIFQKPAIAALSRV